MTEITYTIVVEKLHVWGLFKNVQMQGAQKAELRFVPGYALSGAGCSATKQMTVFQQPQLGLLEILLETSYIIFTIIKSAGSGDPAYNKTTRILKF